MLLAILTKVISWVHHIDNAIPTVCLELQVLVLSS